MSGLNTGGFALSALPRAPDVPANIGKIDVQAIYDAVQRGLQTQEQVRMGAPRQSLELAQNATAQDQARAQQALIPSATLAAQNTNLQTAGLAAPDIVAGKRGLALASNAADTQLERNKGAVAGFLGSQPVERLAAGPLTTTAEGTTRDGKGNLVTTETKSTDFGSGAIPVGASTSTTPTTPIITPIGQPGGLPMGNLIQTVGPDGKPVTQVVQAPLAALNSINVGTTWQKIGSRRDPETGNLKDVYQAFTQSAVGQPLPHGAPVERDASQGPPGSDGASNPVSPFLSKDALKTIDEARSEVGTLSARKLELENIANASEALINSSLGAGRVAGPIASFFGLPEAQAFVGSVQNALQTALQPLRGTGRVSNTEFNQALSALPKITDQPETIRAKLKYLNLATDWAMTRQKYFLDNLGAGLNQYEAFKQAEKNSPIPSVPDFYSGASTPSATGVPVPQPGAAQPLSFATEAEAAAARAAGKINPGDRITVAGQSGIWHD